MATTTGLMTVEKFRALPDPPGGRYELHHGELFVVSYPKLRHWDAQQTLSDLLKAIVGKRGRVGTEFAFRPLPEYEFWAADVAFVSREQIARIDPDDNLLGVPEIVIEVVSPSNTIAELNERQAICLDNGGFEFWVVDPKRRTVKITNRDLTTAKYSAGDQIPLPLLGSATIAVDAIFETPE